MVVTFREENHRYESDPPQKWVSSTKVVEMFTPQFDPNEMAPRCNNSRNSKWYNVGVEKIIELWDKENKRSTDTGSLFHIQQEVKAIAARTKMHRGKELPVISIPFVNGVKTALPQLLQPGCYLEHIVYNAEIGVCGQTDLMLCDGEYIDVLDYKTNKKIEKHCYGYEKYGNIEPMLSPISHLEHCNINHYTIQLSIYMYLALLANPHLKPGKLKIVHVEFELTGKDEFDFPIVKFVDGFPVVRKVTNYELPYLEKEVKDCFEWMNNYKTA